ncbi:MAG: hypothetical protein ABIN89_05120 [Chitinophagaceae bacterium]
MPHTFKQGDRVLFVYEEDLMDGIVQDAHGEEVIIQFAGVSYPSHLEPCQLQYLQPED